MKQRQSSLAKRQKLRIIELKKHIYFFVRETKLLCEHLEKLDRLPLDDSYDFRMYFDHREFIYMGDSNQSSNTFDPQ